MLSEKVRQMKNKLTDTGGTLAVKVSAPAHRREEMPPNTGRTAFDAEQIGM